MKQTKQIRLLKPVHSGQHNPANPATRIQFSDKPHGRISTVLNRLSIHLSTLVLLGVAVIASLAPVPATAQTSTVNICDRTPQVEAAILAAINPSPACEAVPEADLAGITSLDLRETGITSLASGDFTGLSVLNSLNLGGINLTTLPAGVFDSLSALRWLSLWGNDLTTLPDGVFDSLSALVTLFLNFNDLTTLPDGVFDSLSALERLGLSVNALTTLPDGVFDSLSALERLDLGFNAFTTLPDGVFDSLAALERLSLRNNSGLTTLLPDIFDDLSALEYLDLTGNNFTTLPAGVFDDVLDTLGSINPDFTDFDPSSILDFLVYDDSSSETDLITALLVDDNTRSAHFICSRTDADTIVAATARVDDCLRITAAQLAVALSPNAGLSALVISEGTLTPLFDRSTFTYSATVPNAVASLTITPTTADSGATVVVTVNGGAAMATTPFTAALDVGANGIEVVVTGADSSMLTYMPVTRESARVNICERTPQVEAAILAAINPSPACEAVPESDLAGITSLDLREAGITSLASGDFTGLSALETLWLFNNDLTTLPDGVFDSLSALETLWLFSNNLTTLPDGVFDSLTALELRDNVATRRFDNLTALETTTT